MHNGSQVLYYQELRVARAHRTGILRVLEEEKLASLLPVAMVPERHPVKYVECQECKLYGRDFACHCGGAGVEVDGSYHCGVEGCYQCEIWPLQ